MRRNTVPASVWKNPVHFLAFGLGTGASPYAPGTVGTLLGIPIVWLLAEFPLWVYMLVTVAIFLLGIWWDRANKHGAIAGMLVGTIITFAPILLGNMFPILPSILPPTSSALVGAPVVILTMIIVSRMTPPPDEKLRRFLVEKVHSP